MLKSLPIGYDFFKEIIDKDLYYVDKTDILEDIIKDKNKVYLFPRPRRFGKSLFLSMVDNFFNIEYKNTNKDLFKDLKISKSDYYKELSSRPVIKIDFKSLKQDNYENVYLAFKELIRELYSNKRYLLDSLNEEDTEIFKSFLNETATIEKYQKSLKILSYFLNKYYNEKVIVLIDEYDVPTQQGYLKGYYEDIVSLIREVFSNALKGNDYLDFAIMTGVLRVSKESLFSDLNNVKVYGIVDEEYSECFGFTESETKVLLNYYGLELNDEVKNMYDGYSFNKTDIYNPWSIINYAQDKKLKPFWVNTSGNELIIDMLRKTTDDIKVVIEKLLNGESVLFEYDEKVTYLDYSNVNSLNNILNLLFISGYLTLDDKKNIFNSNSIMYVKLPNKESKLLFSKILRDELINSEGVNLLNIQEFTQATLDNNKEMMEKTLNKILPSMSFMDSTESFYHGYVLGLFSLLLDENYIVKSNREAGSGRFDLMIESVDRKLGIIIEFKITKEDMELEAVNAINQMKNKEYYKELVLDKVDNIYEYAIVFKGKNAIVR